MSSYYHEKFHRHNHHTLPLSSDVYPDSSHDPIASYEQPFQGDFILNGSLNAKSLSAISKTTAVQLSSKNIAIDAIGDAYFQHFQSYNLIIRNTNTLSAINSKIATSNRFIVNLNGKEYSTRMWCTSGIKDITSQSDRAFVLNYRGPVIIDAYTQDYADGAERDLGGIIDMTVAGTRHIQYQWFFDKKEIPNANNRFLFIQEPGEYIFKASNMIGTLSCAFLYPFEEDILVTTAMKDVVTQKDENIVLDYEYIDIDSNSLLVNTDQNYILA